MGKALSKTVVNEWLQGSGYPTDISKGARKELEYYFKQYRRGFIWFHDMVKACERTMRKEMLAYGT